MRLAVFQQFQVLSTLSGEVIYGLDMNGTLWRRSALGDQRWVTVEPPGREPPKDGFEALLDLQQDLRRLTEEEESIRAAMRREGRESLTVEESTRLAEMRIARAEINKQIEEVRG